MGTQSRQPPSIRLSDRGGVCPQVSICAPAAEIGSNSAAASVSRDGLQHLHLLQERPLLTLPLTEHSNNASPNAPPLNACLHE
ncbi:unnamed protein product [Pleuronectes platessa]|uniref:Uncharacterized protein n=1 Tax=Pleuronectes platessa TaxID=8262 RepID=A0A9N7YQV2_PLEPL|nr:unnamed protein product [Pleuronectes platessa]